MIHPYEQAIRRALEMEGGLYTFEDVLGLIFNSQMQSFSEGDSLIVTRVVDYPQKRVLEIVLLVGVAEEILRIEPRLAEFASDNRCTALLGYGRLGWEKFMGEGWRKVFAFYIKELAP